MEGKMEVSDSESNSGAEQTEEKTKVYIPGGEISDNEELVCDESAYIMYHQAQTGAPCLSFDIVHDDLGATREDFPHSCLLVCGTQAARSHTNSVIVMKMHNLRRTKAEDSDESDDSDDDSDDEGGGTGKPQLETAMIRHNGAVNRIRTTRIDNKHLAASWSETGKVHIWGLDGAVTAVENRQAQAAFAKTQSNTSPLFTFPGHQIEGFALDWCTTSPGVLASGDCNKNIHVWKPHGASGEWHVDQRPFTGHTQSVEDIQWSPNESNVFASCSVDKSIRVWDARSAPHKANKLTASDAHTKDVNVIHWNRNEPFIVSGGDDGVIKIWDLRQFQKGEAVGVFKHHTAAITSVEWHPTDSSVFAASGSDDQLTQWDLAVERDATSDGTEPDVPPQLLFIHQGQQDIKELHWHPQIPGVIISTAASGFNVFRTISV